MRRTVERTIAWLIVCGAVVAAGTATWWMTALPEAVETAGTVTKREEVEDLAAHLDALVPRLMRRYDVPGVGMAIVRDGELAWAAAYGLADRAAGRPMEMASVYQVGSISKPVTARGIMLLAERGLIDLDAPVRTYLRSWDFPVEAQGLDRVTTRMLLSHTAGMPLGSFGNEHDPHGEVPPLRAALTHEAYLLRDPGTGFSYSNVGFNLLELLVEEVTGRGFASFMQEEVLGPIGMERSSFDWSESFAGAIATGYDLRGEPIRPYVYPEKASGGLFSDVTDIARFVAAGMMGTGSGNRPVADRTALEQLYEPTATIGGAFGLVADWYGLGHFLERLPAGGLAAWHGGQGLGWMAHFHAVPDTGDGIVILTNSQRSWPVIATVLGEWARWSGIGSVKFAVISLGVALLWLLVALLAAATVVGAAYILRGLLVGDRSFHPFARCCRVKRAAAFVMGCATGAWLVWASAQPYLMVTSVFPGVTDWAATVLGCFAVVLIASSLAVRHPSSGPEIVDP